MMPNPYLELFRLKDAGKITQEELEAKVKELKENGVKPKADEVNEMLDLSEENTKWG